MRNPFLKLMLVTYKNETPLETYLALIKKLIPHISSIQLREKTTCFNELCEFGMRLQHLLRPYNKPLIVNDNLQVAQALQAGLHLGQSDGDPVHAREVLGPQAILGLTVENIAQLHIANQMPLDYIGIGAIYPSQSKPDTPVWGLKRFKEIASLSRHPVVAIGGITETNADKVFQAGADGVAAIGVFHRHHSVQSAQHLNTISKESHYVYS